MIQPEEFKGKVAVVTGAAQGIGKAIADLLRNVGAKVAEIDTKFSEGQSGKYAIDISDSKSVNNTIDIIEKEIGSIEYLVNVAGVLHTNSLLDCSDEEWNNTFTVNTFGAFNICRAVARKMVTRRSGAIVVIGSNASKAPRIGMGSYAASKAATEQMVKCLGLELAADNIRCNIVAPGSTDTEMQRQYWKGGVGPNDIIAGSLEKHRLGIPLKRIATPNNIANVALFMLSSASSHITLETVVVDGGATLGQ